MQKDICQPVGNFNWSMLDGSVKMESLSPREAKERLISKIEFGKKHAIYCKPNLLNREEQIKGGAETKRSILMDIRRKKESIGIRENDYTQVKSKTLSYEVMAINILIK